MSLFGDIFSAAVDVATSPIEVAKDVATLGGLATGQDESYTGKRLKKIKDDAEEIIDDLT